MLPSLREKKRYLAFEIVSKRPIKAPKSVKKAIELSMLSFIGIKGVANAGAIFLEDKFKGQRGIVRVNNKHVDELKASIALIRKIEDQPVIAKSLGVSGMVNQAERKYIAG